MQRMPPFPSSQPRVVRLPLMYGVVRDAVDQVARQNAECESRSAPHVCRYRGRKEHQNEYQRRAKEGRRTNQGLGIPMMLRVPAANGFQPVHDEAVHRILDHRPHGEARCNDDRERHSMRTRPSDNQCGGQPCHCSAVRHEIRSIRRLAVFERQEPHRLPMRTPVNSPGAEPYIRFRRNAIRGALRGRYGSLPTTSPFPCATPQPSVRTCVDRLAWRAGPCPGFFVVAAGATSGSSAKMACACGLSLICTHTACLHGLLPGGPLHSSSLSNSADFIDDIRQE
jgi:hypothetical protein